MKDVVLAENDDEIRIALKKIDISDQIIKKEFDIIFSQCLGDIKKVQKVHDAFLYWKIIRDEVISLSKMGSAKKPLT